MRELVIVLTDLYLSSDDQPGEPAGADLPGIEHIARFARRAALTDGWRPWLARWLGVGRGAPAAIAAAAAPIKGEPGTSFRAVWMATPVHLVAGLASVHLDRRSILRLTASELEALEQGFRGVFRDSGFRLRPLDSGEFLLFGPDLLEASLRDRSVEPARVSGERVQSEMLGGGGHLSLRRLCAEIEMWLHEHPVNENRVRRGDLPVSALWLWGGGATEPQPARASASPAIVFGVDAFVQGLCSHAGTTARPLPDQLAPLFSYPRSMRAAMAVSVAKSLETDSRSTLLDAVADIDRRFIAPAVAALREGALERLVLVANDRALALSARDRLRFWRRSRPGLSGLR